MTEAATAATVLMGVWPVLVALVVVVVWLVSMRKDVSSTRASTHAAHKKVDALAIKVAEHDVKIAALEEIRADVKWIKRNMLLAGRDNAEAARRRSEGEGE